MRTKSVESLAKENGKLVVEPATEPPSRPPDPPTARPTDPPAEVRELQKKNAAAPSRSTPEAPTGGNASIQFFTARRAYDTHLLSRSVRKELAAAFGAEALPFFELYYRLEKLALDPDAKRPTARELVESVDDALFALGKTGVASRVLNLIWTWRRGGGRGEEGGTSFDEILRKACRKHGRPSDAEWQALSEFFQSAIGTLAREKGVHLTLGREGNQLWPSLRLMSARERDLEALRVEDPMSYQLVLERRTFYQERDGVVQRAIAALEESEGPVASRKASIRKRVVTIADVLDEQGAVKKTLIYDVDAKPRSIDEYIEWRERLAAKKNHLHDDEQPRAERVLTDFQLASLRVLDDVALPLLSGPVEMHDLTDGSTTRSIPTKFYEGSRIVVEGRYAGIPIDSLIDRSGRLIESAIDEPGRHEPYLWYQEEKRKLVLDFPNKRGEWKPVRDALKKLARQEESFEYQSIDRRQPRFSFPVELYEEVERIIGSSRRTSRANQILNEHFAEQALLEAATRSGELARFEPNAIGGFSAEVELWQHQKEALAYLEARGGRGVINLDTGDGKTLVAIAQMLLAVRNGEADREGESGRFLYVCDRDHRGNLPDQIRSFCDEKIQRKLRSRVDVMSYGEFLHASKSGRWKGKPWSPDGYVTAFFDEVHKKLETKSATAEAICAAKSPKVLLTASLVGKNPAMALKLRYVADGVDLFSPEAAGVRAEINKVSRHLSVKVGPYEVGINPARKIRAKQIFEGIFHRQRAPLPVGLTASEERLTMAEPVQAAYANVLDSAKGLKSALQGAASLWRDAGKGAEERRKLAQTDPAIPVADPLDPKIASLNAIHSDLRRAFDLLQDLENRPDHLALDGDRVVDLLACDRPDLKPLIDYNPKLRRAAERFKDKLETSPRSRAAQMIDDKRLVEAAALEMLKAGVPGGHAACLPDRIMVFRHATERAQKNAEAEAAKPGVEYSVQEVDDQPIVKLVYRSSSREFQTGMLKSLQEMMRSIEEDTAIRTISLYRPTYSHGHNIQKGLIDTVIDLSPARGHQASHQSLSRFYRQGTDVESVEHLSLIMTLDRSKEGVTDFDLLPGEIQRARNARERSIYEDSVAAVDEEGLYGGLPPGTRASLIQSRRMFELERDLANGDLAL